MATTYIERTPGSEGNKLKWTFSAWIKRSGTGNEDRIITGWVSTTYESNIVFDSNDKLRFMHDNSGVMLLTNRLFRDCTAWMHIVAVWDSANATSSERMKLYVNGVRETDFATETYPSQNAESHINDDVAQYIGKAGNDAGYFNGVLSHIHMCDGYAYAASDFGETDATSGMWKIKTGPSVSYGSQGYSLKMQDRTNLDLDSSPNAHTFTTGGNLTPTYDNPSNNFSTINNLGSSSYATLSNGANTVTGNNSNNGNAASTLCMAAGKWYGEIELDSKQGDTYPAIGMWQLSQEAFGQCVNGGSNEPGDDPNGFEYFPNGTLKTNNSTTSSWGTAMSAGDILQIAIDCDNGAAYVGVEGTWQNSGDPTSGASKTGAAVTWTPSDKPQGVAFGENTYQTSSVTKYNFGNGYFGTDAVSTTNADGAGIGSFEFAVPTGYYTLCTKNITTYG